MARSESEQERSGASRLPSVEPGIVEAAKAKNRQLVQGNEHFSSMNPEDLVLPVLEVSTNSVVAEPIERLGSIPENRPPVASSDEVIAEVDGPMEEIWDEALAATLGSELQQGLPKPVIKANKVPVARKAIPLARRALEPRVHIFERETEPFRWRDLLTWKGVRQNSSFLVSLVLHTFLLLFLSLLVVKSGIGDSALFLDATSAPAAPDEEMLEAFEINPVVFENENVIADSPLNELVDEAIEKDELSKDALKTRDDLHLDKQLDGTLQSNNRATGDGKSATFFGTKASGRRFVFVVDRSTSMEYGSRNYVSRELFNRYDVAKSELLNAIESLQPHQEFFVLMFAHNTLAMFQNKALERGGDRDFEMISATLDNKSRFQDWLDDTRMGPGTDPRLALEIAIEMEPDAIFMLSDGAFVSERIDDRPKTRDIINRHWSAGTIVPINTISLVVEETIPTMESIANKSGGQFRFTTIKDYVKQIAVLRGPMRSRALEQLLELEGDNWEARAEVISDILLPMLRDSSPIERTSGEALLHRSTMGLFHEYVEKTSAPGSKAFEQWSQIVREVDGYYRTGQVSALGQGCELEQKLLLSVLELQDDSFYGLFEKLDTESISSMTMIELVRAIERAHLEFGTSPESIGWLRYFNARLTGKKPKKRSEYGKVKWSVEQAQDVIDRLFETRSERARDMYQKYKDPGKGLNLRQRLGETIVNKYPETREAGRVRLELEKQRRRKLSTLMPEAEDDSDEIANPYTAAQ